MKYKTSYELIQSAGRAESVLILSSGVGVVGAVLALIGGVWWTSLTLLLLSVIGYGASRILDLLAHLVQAVTDPGSSSKTEPAKGQGGSSA